VRVSTLHQIALNVRRKLARERTEERRRWLEAAFQKVKDSIREAVNRGSLRASTVILSATTSVIHFLAAPSP
jgi:vacuolar-type H+-ATPase subunit E/Vma4